MLPVIPALAAAATALATAFTMPLDIPQPPPAPSGATVEFRLAETKPGPGLTSVETNGQTLYLQPDAVVSTQDIACAVPGIDALSGQPTVNLVLGDTGRKRLAKTTTDGVGRILAIVVDGTLLTAPVIREPILGGSVQISGSLSLADAKDLAGKIGHPPLPRHALIDALIAPLNPLEPPPICPL